jgi:hypothetical protein
MKITTINTIGIKNEIADLLSLTDDERDLTIQSIESEDEAQIDIFFLGVIACTVTTEEVITHFSDKSVIDEMKLARMRWKSMLWNKNRRELDKSIGKKNLRVALTEEAYLNLIRYQRRSKLKSRELAVEMIFTELLSEAA